MSGGKKSETLYFSTLKWGSRLVAQMIGSRRAATGDMSYDDFKKTFFDKFYPRSFHDAKRSEFLKLTYDLMIIGEYEKKYRKVF